MQINRLYELRLYVWNGPNIISFFMEFQRRRQWKRDKYRHSSVTIVGLVEASIESRCVWDFDEDIGEQYY